MQKSLMEKVSKIDEELADAHAMLSKCLDRWVHLVVKQNTVLDGDSLVKKIKDSCHLIMESNVQYYSDLSDIVSKEGYEEEAKRYRQIAKIYASLLK